MPRRLSLLLIAVLIFTSLTVDTNFNRQLQPLLNISYVLKSVQSLEKQIIAKDKNLQKTAFKNLQKQFLKVSWLLPKYFSVHEMEQLNNSKYWVLNDNIEKNNYSEAGAFQILEKRIISQKSDCQKELLAIGIIKKSLLKLHDKITQQPIKSEDYFPLIYIALQTQYLLQLTGYEDLNSSNTIPKVEASLLFFQTLPISQDLKNQLNNLSKALKNRPFENLNRWDLYQDYYKPILADLKEKFTHNVPTYLSEKSGQNFDKNDLFSENFLNPRFYLHDTLQTDSQTINLGKILFFEPLLSANNKRACASCHKPQKAFSDGRQTSIAFNISEKLTRNSPTLFNSVFNQYFSHDLAKKTLEKQILFVVHSPKEFNSNLSESVEKLSKSSEYQVLFKKSFPQKPIIDSTNILKALVSYIATLKSFDSKFDSLMANSSVLNKDIKAGYNLFMGKAGCGSCHFAPLFSGLKPPFFQSNEYHNLGIPKSLGKINLADDDMGLLGSEEATFTNQCYAHFFKTPSVRNLKYTEPLMHNGVYIRLQEALTFHISTKSINSLTTYPNNGVKLTENEIKAILLFLNNLNTENPQKKFTDPKSLPNLNNLNNILDKRRKGGVY
ncbi:MAG: cytochrome c peroxidase [Bacteroidota bacterium]